MVLLSGCFLKIRILIASPKETDLIVTKISRMMEKPWSYFRGVMWEAPCHHGMVWPTNIEGICKYIE
jgi:hypothetical protein